MWISTAHKLSAVVLAAARSNYLEILLPWTLTESQKLVIYIEMLKFCVSFALDSFLIVDR